MLSPDDAFLAVVTLEFAVNEIVSPFSRYAILDRTGANRELAPVPGILVLAVVPAYTAVNSTLCAVVKLTAASLLVAIEFALPQVNQCEQAVWQRPLRPVKSLKQWCL